MKVTVRKISISSKPERTFYLKLEWAEDLGAGFVMVLSDGVSAWSGEVSEEDVSREAEEMEILRERYVADLQKALTVEGRDAQVYQFHLTSERGGGPGVQLSYEKVQSDISFHLDTHMYLAFRQSYSDRSEWTERRDVRRQFRLGMVELLPVLEPSEVIRELISYGLEQSSRLQAENKQLHKENQRLRKEQEHVTSQMERYVEEKEMLERDLYSRFVLVVNEKKAKIRALQEKIKELQDSAEEEKQRLKKGRAGGSEPADEEPEEKSDYGSTTEEEEEEEEDGDPKPSHSSKDVLESNPMDESLNDITDVAPSRKRRHRHLQPPQPQTKRPAVQQRQSSRSKRRRSKQS